MKNYFIIALLFLAVNACARNKSKNVTDNAVETIEVNLSNAGLLTYDEHFSSTILVPLETTEESLIAQIDKLYITEKHIIIFDQKTMNILLFGIDGHFIGKIGHKGNGPGEYLFINDIQFNKKDSLIYAHERYLNCIYKYNLSGQLIEKTPKSKIYFNSFHKTEDGYWVYSCFENDNPQKYNLMLLDEQLNKVKGAFFPQENFINASFLPTFMADEHDRLFFIYPSSNIIYELQHENATPFAIIDFGRKTMPYDQIIKLKNSEEYDRLIADKKYLGDVYNFKINKNSFFFSFRETGLNVAAFSYNAVYNFSTGKVDIYKNPFIESMKYPVFTQLLYASDDVLIYPIYPMVLSEDSFTLLSKELSADIRFDSNPILAFLQIK